MSSKSKRKGYKFENEIKKRFIKAGFECDRLAQAYQPDLILKGFGKIECKCKKSEFGNLYKYLTGNMALVVKKQSPKEKGNKPLAIIPFDTFLHLLLTKEVYKNDKFTKKGE